MTNNNLKSTQRQEIKTLVLNITADQTKEIKRMKEWRKT